MINSIIICVRPILTYLVMYNGDKVLGLLGGVFHVHILTYGVPKVFPVAKACSRYVPSIGYLSTLALAYKRYSSSAYVRHSINHGHSVDHMEDVMDIIFTMHKGRYLDEVWNSLG
jgi:hypothetical protein